MFASFLRNGVSFFGNLVASLCAELNIVIEKSIGLSSSGKQFDIPNSISAANLIAHEAIFLLSYKSYEPIKLKSSKKIRTDIEKETFDIQRINLLK